MRRLLPDPVDPLHLRPACEDDDFLFLRHRTPE
jgi:hypothetical protein